jgi:hypothetical protein
VPVPVEGNGRANSLLEREASLFGLFSSQLAGQQSCNNLRWAAPELCGLGPEIWTGNRYETFGKNPDEDLAVVDKLNSSW